MDVDYFPADSEVITAHSSTEKSEKNNIKNKYKRKTHKFINYYHTLYVFKTWRLHPTLTCSVSFRFCVSDFNRNTLKSQTLSALLMVTSLYWFPSGSKGENIGVKKC